MKVHSAGLGAAALALALCAAASAQALDYASTLVTIKVTTQSYDSYSPWRKRAPAQDEIQGCVIEGRRILTLAQPLTDQVLVEVTKHGSPRRYPAEVLLRDPVAGLALLGVPDNSFFDDLVPAPLSSPGPVHGELRAARWEAGGVLREFTASLVKTTVDYWTPIGGTLAHFLSTDMDRGGSGEAVFVDGKLLGLAYRLEQASKSLKVLSVEATLRLLADLADGSYGGYPSTWEYAKGLEGDRDLKRYLGMGDEETGVLVTAIPPRMSGAGVLKVNDVILAIDGELIDDSGLYRSRDFGLLHYDSLIFLNHAPGDTLAVRVLRDGSRLDLRVPLLPLGEDSFLIPLTDPDTPPQYVVFGGLVFQELSRSYLQGAWGNDWWRLADTRLRHLYDAAGLFPSSERRRVVILNRVLPHAVNAGYQSESNLVLESLGGTPVRDLQHLESLLTSTTERFAVFNFAGKERIVLDLKRALGAEKEIMSLYGLPATANVASADGHGS